VSTHTVDGIRYTVRLGSWVPVLLAFGKDCITIRRTIYARRPAMHRRTHAHEAAHVRQWAQLGFWRFLWRYLRDLVRFGYKKHPLELEAHEYAHDRESQFPNLP
jgi:hypothetical protein